VPENEIATHQRKNNYRHQGVFKLYEESLFHY